MQVKERKEIDDKFKWKLEDIIASDNEWNKQFKKISARKSELLVFQGKLNNKEDILACLQLQSDLSREMNRLYVYAKMRQDQDLSINLYKSMTDKIENLSVEISTNNAFVEPELVLNSKEFLESLVTEPTFSEYDYALKELIRNKDRTLSENEEKLLAQASSFSGMFQDAFMMFDNADITFGEFDIADGSNVKLSHGLYSLLMQSKTREDRKKAFESMFSAYKNMINTVAVLYGGNVKSDLFFAKAHKFNSCIEQAMNNENVPVEVYDKLVKCVHDNLDKMYEYLEYRRQKLGYDKLHMYDLHVPLTEEGALSVTYDEAKEIVLSALKPLGDDYSALLQKAFNERWIDIYENKGKRSGAYSWGCYDAHPYVLLNYQATTTDVFTIAHELGHSMHSFYSNTNQPYSKASYEIFVAEVASTVNETLLLKYLLSKSSKANKRYLLSYMLDMFRTTVFRQTQFAEFEAIAHNMAENGEPLIPETLCEAYYKLNKKYYGEESICQDELIQYEWARIPHFYNSFYVYKYATGLISAVCIATKILAEGQSAVDDYKKFLSAGGSMPPAEILKLAGVDLTTDAPYKQAMDFFEATLKELKSLD